MDKYCNAMTVRRPSVTYQDKSTNDLHIDVEISAHQVKKGDYSLIDSLITKKRTIPVGDPLSSGRPGIDSSPVFGVEVLIL